MERNPLILVHGAWHGGWCWEKIIPFFQANGHRVFAPTLTGPTLTTNLSTHINDIVQLIREKGITNVILVGHSYAGSILSGVAEVMPEKIGKLVYLDAIVPENGKSTVDYLPSLPSYAKEISIPSGKVTVLLPPLPEKFGVNNEDDIAWMEKLLTPTALSCFTEKSRISNPLFEKISKTYILCTIRLSPESGHAFLAAYRKFESAGLDCHKIDAPHDVMITHPAELAELLLKIVS